MDEARLALAAQAAAAGLKAGGTAACADGATVSCSFAGGARAIVRNSLQPVSTFSAEHLLSQVSLEIVRALLAGRQGGTAE